jgi:HAD superfamily hydrolase (TIGR01549 family)
LRSLRHASVSQMKRHFIFDLDGTLSRPVYDFALLRRQLQAAVPSRFGPETDVLHELETLSPVTQRRASDVIDEFEEEGRGRWEWNDGALELLRYLDEQKVLKAVVTRNSDVSLNILAEKMREANLKPFEYALSRTFRPVKPSPAPALHILEKWQVPPQQCYFVGDGIHDLECSKAGGTVGILIRNTKGHHLVREVELEAKALHAHAFDDMAHFHAFLKDEQTRRAQ